MNRFRQMMVAGLLGLAVTCSPLLASSGHGGSRGGHSSHSQSSRRPSTSPSKSATAHKRSASSAGKKSHGKKTAAAKKPHGKKTSAAKSNSKQHSAAKSAKDVARHSKPSAPKKDPRTKPAPGKHDGAVTQAQVHQRTSGKPKSSTELNQAGKPIKKPIPQGTKSVAKAPVNTSVPTGKSGRRYFDGMPPAGNEQNPVPPKDPRNPPNWTLTNVTNPIVDWIQAPIRPRREWGSSVVNGIGSTTKAIIGVYPLAISAAVAEAEYEVRHVAEYFSKGGKE
jgi:hypothetical protein